MHKHFIVATASRHTSRSDVLSCEELVVLGQGVEEAFVLHDGTSVQLDLVRHGLGSGEAVLVPGACQVAVGDMRGACGVTVPLPDHWSRAARQRLVSGGAVGPLPRVRCRLCRSSDHDVVLPLDVRLTVAGSDTEAKTWVSPRRRATNRAALQRAERAGRYPYSQLEQQRAAAGEGRSA
jgi:hypothetical protein